MKRLKTHDVGDLTKRLLLQIFRGLLLALEQVDGDELVWNLFLGQDGSDLASAGRATVTVEFQGHNSGRCASIGNGSGR